MRQADTTKWNNAQPIMQGARKKGNLEIQTTAKWTQKARKYKAQRFTDRVTVIFLCVASVTISVAHGANDEDRNENIYKRGCSGFLIYENDQLLTDRNYTFGLLAGKTCIYQETEEDGNLENTKEGTLKKEYFLQKWNKKWWTHTRILFDIGEGNPKGTSSYAGLSLYTPNSITDEEPKKGAGRPYASLIMFGNTVVHVGEDSSEAIKQGIQFGVLGLPLGGNIQAAIHKVVDSEEPRGWESEISRGGEPTLLYSLQKNRRLYPKENANLAHRRKKTDVGTDLGLTLGYYSSLQAGAALRWGEIHSPFWASYGPIHNNIARTVAIPGKKSVMNNSKNGDNRKRTPEEGYLFLRGGLDIVLYNALLQGQFRKNDFEIDSSGVARIIPYLSAGFVKDCGRWQLSISHNFRGREIMEGEDHRWTSFSIRRSY